jgi:hypothetical protein
LPIATSQSSARIGWIAGGGGDDADGAAIGADGEADEDEDADDVVEDETFTLENVVDALGVGGAWRSSRPRPHAIADEVNAAQTHFDLDILIAARTLRARRSAARRDC